MPSAIAFWSRAIESRSFRRWQAADAHSASSIAPIDPAALLAEVSRHANGATLLFVGTVRDVNDGRAVSGIEYKAYRAMAERELADIAARGRSTQFAHRRRRGRAPARRARAGRSERRDRRRASASRRGVRREPVRDRGAQAARSDLEARALRRRHARVGRARRQPRQSRRRRHDAPDAVRPAASSSLRISVTDRCNFRCLYCMPEEGMSGCRKRRHPAPTRKSRAIVAAARAARLSTHSASPAASRPPPRSSDARPNCSRACRSIRDIALRPTACGWPSRRAALRDAGLRPRQHEPRQPAARAHSRRIARRDLQARSVARHRVAERAGFDRIKLNVVVMRGVNDDELDDSLV